MRKKSNKVVYLHKKKGTDEVVYVGIGSPSRPFDFVNRNPFWQKIHNKYGIDVEVIHEGLTWDEACTIEVELIAYYGRRDLGTGTLCNLTDGADGATNISEECRVKRGEKISKAKIGSKRKPFSDEWKAKLSKASKGRPQSIEARVKRSATLTKTKVKIPSKATVEVILKLYIHRSPTNGAYALADRLKLPPKLVASIGKRESILLEYYGIKE